MRSDEATRRRIVGRRPVLIGAALMITIIFLALFASLALALSAAADTNLTLARNRIETQRARALAETGLSLVQRQLGGMELDADAVNGGADELLEAVASHLEQAFGDSSMVDAGDIASDPVSFTANVDLGDGLAGAVDITIVTDGGACDEPTIAVECTGRFGRARRTVRYELTVQGGNYTLGPDAIASQSYIRLLGNSRISGVNDDSEGSILSATYSRTNAVQLVGNTRVSGDVAVCNPDGRIVGLGHTHIGGEAVIGAGEPAWPEVDPGVFEPYVEGNLSGSTIGNRTFTNVRIPAGTNPTFIGNTRFNGVVYVESPNRVTFLGNTTVHGVIVCEPPETENLNANKILMLGNLSTAGVENLPDQPRYDGLRNLTGSFLLAEGFNAEFYGNFNTVNGSIVASRLRFLGNAVGVVRGGILNLDDSVVKMTGNTRLRFDKESAYGQPAGLKGSYLIVCRSGTYEE